jgi:hypothetical protein
MLYFYRQGASMLIPILHRKRKAAEMAAKAIGQAGGAVEETRRVL